MSAGGPIKNRVEPPFQVVSMNSSDAISIAPDFCLVPASTAVPAAAAQQENDDHYDE
jgi:phage terminase small subunit